MNFSSLLDIIYYYSKMILSSWDDTLFVEYFKSWETLDFTNEIQNWDNWYIGARVVKYDAPLEAKSNVLLIVWLIATFSTRKPFKLHFLRASIPWEILPNICCLNWRTIRLKLLLRCVEKTFLKNASSRSVSFLQIMLTYHRDFLIH